MNANSRVIGSGGGGGGGCFAGSTLVSVPNGQTRIDEIREGTEVLSFDDKGKIAACKVLKVHKHEQEEVTRYNLWGGEFVDATPNHWVLNQFNAFVEIGTLGPDDCLVDVCNHLRPIVSKKPLGKSTVYNLTVEGRHTFIANNVRVHNAGLGLRIAGSGGLGSVKSSKGGGGSANTPPREAKVAKDNTVSRQYAYVYDLISEGEIEGLVNRGASIFLNETQLQSENPDGTRGLGNFGDAEVHIRNGTQVQSRIPLSIGSETEVGVGTELKKGVHIVRAISDSEVDRVRVTISVPVLQRQNKKNGDVSGTSVRHQFFVRYANGSRVKVADDTIKGRSGDLYQRDIEFELDRPNPNDIVEVSVLRITNDENPNTPELQNASFWASFTQIKTAGTRYPNSAIIATRVDAEQFSSIPRRKYHIKGVKVRTPRGATVDQDTGRVIYPENFFWDGTFSAATWCADPAWILWDLLTNTRYGFGDHILTPQEKANFTGNASRLSKFDFFAASKYNNELVPDGLGGLEPRFLCNASIQSPSGAFETINNLLSVMRCQGYWSAGSLAISQDRPSDPVFLFSQANIVGDFNYTGSSLKQRSTVVGVSYLDIPSQDVRYEYIEDQEGISKYGVVRKDVEAFGCTSRGQAARLGRWILHTEKFERDVVGFTCSIEAGIVVRPGDVILISDQVKTGERFSGLIKAINGNTFTVDTISTDLAYGSGSLLHVVLPDGSTESRAIISGGLYVDALYISDSPGRYIISDQLTVEQAYTIQPFVNSAWLLESTGLSGTEYVAAGYVFYSEGNQALYIDNIRSGSDVRPATWRVISVEEEDGVLYNVKALSYNPSKYANIESDEPLERFDVTNLNEPPGAVQNLRVLPVTIESGEKVKEVVSDINGRRSVKISVAWQSVRQAIIYEVSYRHEDENFTTLSTQSNLIDIPDAKRGLYEIRVTPIKGLLRGPEAAITYEVVGSSRKLPQNIQSLSFERLSDLNGVLRWPALTDPSVINGGKVLVRYDPRLTEDAYVVKEYLIDSYVDGTSAATWENSDPIADPLPSSQNSLVIPTIPGTYFVKTEAENLDDLPVLRSDLAASVEVTRFDVDVNSLPLGNIAKEEDKIIPKGLDGIGFHLGYAENLFFNTYTIDPPAPQKKYSDAASDAFTYAGHDYSAPTTLALMVATELYVDMDFAEGNYYNYDGKGEYVLGGNNAITSFLLGRLVVPANDHLQDAGLVNSEGPSDTDFDMFVTHKYLSTTGRRREVKFDSSSGLFNTRLGFFDGDSVNDRTSLRNYLRGSKGYAGIDTLTEFNDWVEFTRGFSASTVVQTKIELATEDQDSTLSVSELTAEVGYLERAENGKGTIGRQGNPFFDIVEFKHVFVEDPRVVVTTSAALAGNERLEVFHVTEKLFIARAYEDIDMYVDAGYISESILSFNLDVYAWVREAPIERELNYGYTATGFGKGRVTQ